MNKQLRALRLREGDIIVVATVETAQRLMACARVNGLPRKLKGEIPIVVAPEGISRLSVARLRWILKHAERREEKKNKAVAAFLGAPDGEV